MPDKKQDVATLSRQQKRRQRTREAIIEAAAAIFSVKSVSATTVADITEQADVGYGSFYNYFQGLPDVISAVAGRTMARIVEITDSVLVHETDRDIAPAVSLRIVMRLMVRDASIHSLLERPHIFVTEWREIIGPSIERYRAMKPDEAVFMAMGGVDVLLRMLPWMVISELQDAITNGTSGEHEDNLANMSLHLLGLDGEQRRRLADISKRIVDSVGL